jgi:hypothetical protein
MVCSFPSETCGLFAALLAIAIGAFPVSTRLLSTRVQIGLSSGLSPELDGGFVPGADPHWSGGRRTAGDSTPRNIAITREKSGRLDLNQRPFGPQPNALPDCATPREPRVYASFPSGRGANMRSMTGEETGSRKCYRCGQTKSVDDFAWRRKAGGQRDTFCRPCRSAYGREPLRGQPPAVHRSGREGKAHTEAGTHSLPDRVLQEPSLRRLRGGRSRRLGVRSSTRQVICYRPGDLP